MLRVRAGSLALVVLATTVACGTGGTPDAGPTSAPPSGTGTTPGLTTPAVPTAYVSAPVDVTLTAPGSTLEIGHPAVAGWTPRSDLVGVVRLEVTDVASSTVQKAFDGYAIDDATAKMTPYFVTVKAENVGSTDLGGLTPPLYVEDDADDLVEPTGFADTYEPCPSAGLPTPFTPGSRATLCLVYLLPEGTAFRSALFQPPVGVDPITWTGAVTKLKLPGHHKHDKHQGKHQGKHHEKGGKR